MRLFTRLDVKNNNIIKPINFEGLRKVGKPLPMAKKYYEEGIDEILFMDAVASLYNRKNLFNIIKQATKNIFRPITIGGGIKSLKDVKNCLLSGADKVAINSAFVKNINLLSEMVKIYGSSTIISYIETKKINGNWLVFFNNGKENSGINLLDWIYKVQNFGCGEILLTSIDKDGTLKGCDYELLNLVYKKIKVPLIYSGGCKNIEDVKKFKKKYPQTALSISSLLHYDLEKISDIKKNI